MSSALVHLCCVIRLNRRRIKAWEFRCRHGT
jgi:hypothetical protein